MDFYVHVTVHLNKFLYIKTSQLHQFPKFTPAWNSTCFGQFLCPSSGVYSPYTRHWYMSYRFVDSFQAGPGWNILVVLKSCLQTCMTYTSAEWYMSYRFVDSFRAGPGWNILVLLKSCLQTCMTYTSAECMVNKLLMMGRRTAQNM